MRKLFLVFLVIVAHNSIAQTASNETDIKIYRIPYPAAGGSMEYRFPNNVEASLNGIIDKIKAKSGCLLAAFNDDQVRLTFIPFRDTMSFLKSDQWQMITLSTNRHWQHNGKPIPIYFESDIRFSCVDWTINDGFTIIFKAKDWIDTNCKIIFKEW